VLMMHVLTDNCDVLVCMVCACRRVVLSDRELELVRRLQAGAFPHPEFAAEEDYSDYFTYKVYTILSHC
jgi:hypothetical protein